MSGDSPNPSWTVCTCNNCSEHLEFDPSNAGETIQCPHCKLDTVLFVPGASLPKSDATQNLTDEFVKQANRTLTERSGPIITTTGNEVSGHTIESYLGIVRGIVVRSPNLAQSFFGGLNQLVGGNIESYAEVCEQARSEAFGRMVARASEMGADAIITVRYDATEFAPGITEVLAYGTAVKLANG
jgi:uncharacterized protein YbjQ (UPF0145 family)